MIGNDLARTVRWSSGLTSGGSRGASCDCVCAWPTLTSTSRLAPDAPRPSAAERALGLRLKSVERIWDQAPHSAFTDLLQVGDRLLCAFREGERHALGEAGRIRAIARDPGGAWRSVALLEEPAWIFATPSSAGCPTGASCFFAAALCTRARPCVAVARGSTYRRTPVRDSGPRGRSFSTTPSALRRTGSGASPGSARQATGSCISPSHPSRGAPIWSRPRMARVTATSRPSRSATGRRRWRSAKWMAEICWRSCGTTGRTGARRWGGLPLPSRIGVSSGSLNTSVGPTWSDRPPRRDRRGRRFPGGVARTALSHLGLRLDGPGPLGPPLVLPSAGDTSYPGMLRSGEDLLVSYYSSHEDARRSTSRRSSR